MLTEKLRRIIEELVFLKDIISYIDPEEQAKPGGLEKKVTGAKTREAAANEFLEQTLLQLRQSSAKDSVEVKRKSENRSKERYEIAIKYQENENERILELDIEDEDDRYRFQIRRQKPVPDKAKYHIAMLYRQTAEEEQLKLSYDLRDYPAEREHAMQDFTNQLDKTLHIFPESLMGGVLGFTYLGENFMGRRADLTGDKARMVDVHEAIHTDNEYETRVLTDWMLSRQAPRYKR